ncbi:uncharacterized protein LOC117316305 [Pecten maximus]|uniref:uncharacterized protein LOC117316305 n=1 Tax=Pecten maximus TaxID=6579 RepID=UPI001457FEFD|nr:uncharacterized protein LOC117316305 [Pecten maximus]
MESTKAGHYHIKGVKSADTVETLVIKLFSEGLSFTEISKRTGLAKSSCFRIADKYITNGTEDQPRGRPIFSPKLTPEVLQFIEYQKTKQAAVYANEIYVKLLEENICNINNIPSVRTIQYAINKIPGMTYKVMQKIPSETTTARFEGQFDHYLAEVLSYKPEQLHFFDEASVIRTDGNRKRGHAVIGEKAVEVQKYASNATYTVNLCVGYFGIDYFSIIDGPSNANIMIQFFDDALQETNHIGNPIFAAGDCVIMDNCGFHHQRFGETFLKNMLGLQGLHLVFLPPYSPELNPAEFVFKCMRDGLKKNPILTYEYTEYSVVNAITGISENIVPKVFSKCGYV